MQKIIILFSMVLLTCSYAKEYPNTPPANCKALPTGPNLLTDYLQGAIAANHAAAKPYNSHESCWHQDFLTNNPRIARALLEFSKGQRGNSIRNLQFSDATPAKIHKILIAKGFWHQRTGIKLKDKWLARDGRLTVRPHADIVAQDIYVHPDGGMIRVKPEGIPASIHLPRKHPYYVKAVLVKLEPCNHLHCQHDTSFNNEAFKVSTDDIPLPKAPTYGLKIPKIATTSLKLYAFRQGWIDSIMHHVHLEMLVQYDNCKVLAD